MNFARCSWKNMKKKKQKLKLEKKKKQKLKLEKKNLLFALLSLMESKKSTMKWLFTFWVNVDLIGSVLLNFTNLWNCARFISIYGSNNAWFWLFSDFNETFFFRSRDRQISQKGNDGDDKNEQEGLLDSYKPTFFDEISRRRRCVLTKFSPI